MSDPSREQEQQRVERIHAFEQELAQLQAERVLSLEPAQRPQVRVRVQLASGHPRCACHGRAHVG